MCEWKRTRLKCDFCKVWTNVEANLFLFSGLVADHRLRTSFWKQKTKFRGDCNKHDKEHICVTSLATSDCHTDLKIFNKGLPGRSHSTLTSIQWTLVSCSTSYWLFGHNKSQRLVRLQYELTDLPSYSTMSQTECQKSCVHSTVVGNDPEETIIFESLTFMTRSNKPEISFGSKMYEAFTKSPEPTCGTVNQTWTTQVKSSSALSFEKNNEHLEIVIAVFLIADRTIPSVHLIHKFPQSMRAQNKGSDHWIHVLWKGLFSGENKKDYVCWFVQKFSALTPTSILGEEGTSANNIYQISTSEGKRDKTTFQTVVVINGGMCEVAHAAAGLSLLWVWPLSTQSNVYVSTRHQTAVRRCELRKQTRVSSGQRVTEEAQTLNTREQGNWILIETDEHLTRGRDKASRYWPGLITAVMRSHPTVEDLSLSDCQLFAETSLYLTIKSPLPALRACVETPGSCCWRLHLQAVLSVPFFLLDIRSQLIATQTV